MAEYRALISPATDPASFSAELPFSALTWTEELNGPGSATVSMPLRPTRPGAVEVLTAANLNVASQCLWIERSGKLLWGGLIWGLAGDVASNSLEVFASGFHSYTRRRVIRQTLTYSSQDQLVIVRDLIDKMEAVGGSLGLIGTTEATTSGVNRDRTYSHWDRKNYGEAIEQLAAVNNGFDFRYDVAYVSGVPTVEFVTQYPSLGRQTAYVFDLGSNVELLSFTRDGASMANQVDGLGQGEGPNKLIRTAADTTRLTSEPLLQNVVAFPDVSVESTLKAHAEHALSRGICIDQYNVRLAPSGPPTIGAYLVGDIVNLRGSYGYLDVDGDFRITSLTTTVGQEGEVVDANLASLAAFEAI